MSRTRRAVVAEPEPVYSLTDRAVRALETRPALCQQLGEIATQQLIAIIRSPETARVNSIWAETLFPSVLGVLLRECPDLREPLQAAAKAVLAGVYQGPRERSRSISCPRCGDTATMTGPFTAACWSCGTIHPPRMR